MNVTISKLAIAIAIVLFGAGCKKDISMADQEIRKEVNLSLVYKMPGTMEEKQLVENLRKITNILKELYKDRTNLKVVNASIFAKAYTDGSVLLKDLIYPDHSRLQANKKFKTLSENWGIQLRSFARNFWTEVGRGNDPSFKAFLENLKQANLQPATRADGTSKDPPPVSIYTPYVEVIDIGSQGWHNYEPITSIVTATADADEGYGSKPKYINGILQSYIQVLINDDYVYNNPTQIVGINGIEPVDEKIAASPGFTPGDVIDLPDLPRDVKQVYVDGVQCKKQYDALISFTGNGGGSEIRFTRADGFLKLSDGQVQADTYVTGDKTISRYSIRKHNWVDYSSEWDGDWEATNLQENLAIYEEDNRNSSSFSASLETTLTFRPAGSSFGTTVKAPIGFTINYNSDDAIIKQTNYNRDVFFILNRTNLEGEMKNNWPVRDKNSNVSFTLSDRTYN